ncbi:MAG: ribosome maturation factor RimM [Pseudomonadota bacterium]|nr:ribosome maturation factor RimM [Pseudomonadota bacterium]
MSADEFIVIGKLTSAYGIKGWLKAFSYTEPTDNLFSYSPWWVGFSTDQVQSMDVTSHQKQGKLFHVHLKQCSDRNQAEALKGAFIYAKAQDLAALPEGDFYWRDLEGLNIQTPSGQLLGKVAYLIETGSNDVLVIKPTPSSIDSRERMIPYLPEQFDLQVDLELAMITVDWDPEF